MGLNVPKRGRNPYRAKAGAKELDTSWRLDPVRYDAALAEAQAKANASGLDVGLFPCDLSKSWSTRFLPAKQYRTGDDTVMVCGHRCQVVIPPAHACSPMVPKNASSKRGKRRSPST